MPAWPKRLTARDVFSSLHRQEAVPPAKGTLTTWRTGRAGAPSTGRGFYLRRGCRAQMARDRLGLFKDVAQTGAITAELPVAMRGSIWCLPSQVLVPRIGILSKGAYLRPYVDPAPRILSAPRWNPQLIKPSICFKP